MTLLYCRAKRMNDISTVGTLESASAKLPCGFHMLAKYQSVGAVNFVGDLAETQPTLSTCHFQPRPAADAAQAEPSDGLGRALEGGTYTAHRGAGQVWFCWLGGMGVGFGLSGKRSCVASLCPMCSLEGSMLSFALEPGCEHRGVNGCGGGWDSADSVG